jgi:hypothetical protein
MRKSRDCQEAENICSKNWVGEGETMLRKARHVAECMLCFPLGNDRCAALASPRRPTLTCSFHIPLHIFAPFVSIYIHVLQICSTCSSIASSFAVEESAIPLDCMCWIREVGAVCSSIWTRICCVLLVQYYLRLCMIYVWVYIDFFSMRVTVLSSYRGGYSTKSMHIDHRTILFRKKRFDVYVVGVLQLKEKSWKWPPGLKFTRRNLIRLTMCLSI